VIAAFLEGCGGDSTTEPTGSGGGSTATVRGQVVTDRAGTAAEPVLVVALQRLAGVGLAEAQVADTPLAGTTVTLTCDSGLSALTRTDRSGRFLFENVPSGVCTLTVEQDGVRAPGEIPVVVGAGDTADVTGRVTPRGLSGTVTVSVDDVGAVTRNDVQLGIAINIANASTARASGRAACDLEAVIDLREQRLGWGEIAHRCGVDPRVIGLGRSDLSDDDLRAARERLGRDRGRGAAA